MPTRHTHSLSVLLLLELIKFLLLEGSWLAEGEFYLVSSKFGVGVANGAKAVLNACLIKWVKEDGFGALSVDCNTGLASSNAAWLYNIVKNSTVYGLEGS